MSRGPRPRYDFRPGTMTWAEAAAFAFRRSESWLRDHLPSDFPQPDQTYDVFCTEAVETWVRSRFGLVSAEEEPEDAAEERLLGKLGDGKREGPVSRRPTA